MSKLDKGTVKQAYFSQNTAKNYKLVELVVNSTVFEVQNTENRRKKMQKKYKNRRKKIELALQYTEYNITCNMLNNSGKKALHLRQNSTPCHENEV